MADAGDEKVDEVDKAPGVEEWLEDESQAGAVGVRGEGDSPAERVYRWAIRAVGRRVRERARGR
jgi:hypothetical protein